MKRILYCTAIVALACACSAQNQRFDKNASALVKKFEDLAAQGKIMYGHQDDLLYGHSWKVSLEEQEYTKSDVKDVCGSWPAVYGLDLGGIELLKEKNLDNNYFSQIRESALKHYARGGVVTFSWHPRNPLTGGDAWDVSSKEVVASILKGGSRHDFFMGWLKNVADYFETFTLDDGSLCPLIFRPWHEHTGSWFWWGEDLCTVEQYKALWEMTYNYLSCERGLKNLIWSYSPGAGGLTAERIGERYPGNGIVDIVGLDCYQYSSAGDFIAELQHTLSLVKDFAFTNGKLFALTEAGCEGLPQADWWTSTLYPAIAESRPLYVLTWRNACDNPCHFYAPYPGQASAADFVAFTEKDEIVMCK